LLQGGGGSGGGVIWLSALNNIALYDSLITV
jgi:hypothetical protein